MSYKNRPPALSGNVNTWAERLNDWLVKNQDKLSYYLAGQSAAEDGILMWDRDNSQVVVSSNGSWVALTGGGGGTITNYLRDDADDSTNFRLTMGGLTVDTDTLYVDSVNNEVGIGTTSPSEKLEVVGNVEATEFIGDLRGAVVFKAQAGEALTKGDVVYISGISGNTTVVSKADADDAAKMPAFGLAAINANNNASLEVYTFGTLSGLDTSSYTEGDELFVGTTAGALVSAAPAGEGSLVQKIGKVTRSHASSGSIKIMGAGRTNATPNLNDGNIFLGNSSNQAATASFTTEVANATTGKADLSGAAFTGDVSVAGTVTADALTVDTDTLYVDATNDRVGIGTTTPASTLTVKSSSFSQLRLEDDDDSLQIGYSSASAYIKTGDNNTKINFRKTNNTDVMTVDMATERVGIGTTNPQQKLDVNGNIRVQGTYPKIEFVDTDSNPDFTLIGGNGAVQFYDETNSTSRLLVNSSGNVGIGTTSPATELDVDGTITANGISLGDSESIAVGADDDLTITHDGTDATIQNDTGDLIVDVNDAAGNLEIQHEGVRVATMTDQSVAFYMGSGSFPVVNILSSGTTFFSDITMHGTTTVDGRDVSADGDALDSIRRVQFSDGSSKSVNTTAALDLVIATVPSAAVEATQTMKASFLLRTRNNTGAVKLSHTYYVNTMMQSKGRAGVSIGTPSYVSSPQAYHAWYRVFGDKTKLISTHRGKFATSSTGTNSAGCLGTYYYGGYTYFRISRYPNATTVFNNVETFYSVDSFISQGSYVSNAFSYNPRYITHENNTGYQTEQIYLEDNFGRASTDTNFRVRFDNSSSVTNFDMQVSNFSGSTEITP